MKLAFIGLGLLALLIGFLDYQRWITVNWTIAAYLWITEYVTVYDGQHRVPTVSVMEFHDGKVIHETQYFAERFEPPAWRTQWVKVMTEMVEINQNQFDWNEMISKPVITADDKSIGHIDGIMETEFIFKQRLFNPHYYRIPRDSVYSYNHGEVKLKISEEEVYKFKVSQPYKAVGGHTDYYT